MSVVLFAIVIFTFVFYQYGRGIWHPVALKVYGKKNVSEVIHTYQKSTKQALLPLLAQHGVNYPPSKLALIAFKDSEKLELWASNEDGHYSHITTYEIQGASGVLGPKLREGDRQVPEGLYKIIGFNPNSSYHLSMKLNYPNAFDLLHAKAEGRNEPGSNIFIHGRDLSIGCLAMGDVVIEQLFTLVYATGKVNTEVIISPTDPSLQKLKVPLQAPKWTADLYEDIKRRYEIITKKQVVKI